MVVAVGMSSVLGLAASGVVMWTINIGARAQVNMIQSAQSQQILNNFENTVRDSDSITNATATSLSYIFQRFGNCEYHTYTFSTTSGVTSLVHTVRAATLTAGQYCLNVRTALVAGTIGSLTTTTEATNLDVSSGFNYFSADGKRSLRSGETGYDATAVLPLCQMGSVAINLVTATQNNARATVLKTETTTAGIRQNSFALTC